MLGPRGAACQRPDGEARRGGDPPVARQLVGWRAHPIRERIANAIPKRIIFVVGLPLAFPWGRWGGRAGAVFGGGCLGYMALMQCRYISLSKSVIAVSMKSCVLKRGFSYAAITIA